MGIPGGKTAATYGGPDFSVYPGQHVKESPADYFGAILPELQRRAEIVFRFSDAEQRREQVQEVLCVAWRDMLRCLKNGKRFPPASLTYYAILHVRSGNFFRGLHVQDAMSEATRIRGRSALEGLIDWRIKLDYTGFLRSGLLKPKEKRVFGLLARGCGMKEIARRMRIHHCHGWYLKLRIADKLTRYFGEGFPHG